MQKYILCIFFAHYRFISFIIFETLLNVTEVLFYNKHFIYFCLSANVLNFTCIHLNLPNVTPLIFEFSSLEVHFITIISVDIMGILLEIFIRTNSKVSIIIFLFFPNNISTLKCFKSNHSFQLV